MTITYPLAFPSTVNIKGIVPTLKFVSSTTRSPYTFERQAFRWQGEMWCFECTTPPMERPEAEDWIAFAAKLRGRYGTFLFGDKSAETPRGIASGSPLVDTGGQTGYELLVKNLTPNLTGWLLRGDYYQLGSAGTSRLHKLTEDANTDQYGNALLQFAPALRESPANNAPLIITAAKGVFTLTENSVTWSVDENGHYRLGFRAEEAL